MDAKISFHLNIEKNRVKDFKTRVGILNFLNQCNEEQLDAVFKLNVVAKGYKPKYTRDEKITSIMEGLY